MKILQKICFVLLLTAFSSAYAGDCSDGDIDDCRVRAEQGDAKAQNCLGGMYDTGQGAPRDYKEAVKWYRKAAEQGHAKAQYNLGVKYRAGEGVSQDYKESFKWFRKAAEQGCDLAQSAVAEVYSGRMGEFGVEKDKVMALMWHYLAFMDEPDLEYTAFFETEMTASQSQIYKAQKLSREWMRTHFNRVQRSEGSSEFASIGHEVDTYDSGQWKSERNYENGKKEGLWTWWDEEGNITKTETWKNDELVESN